MNDLILFGIIGGAFAAALFMRWLTRPSASRIEYAVYIEGILYVHYAGGHKEQYSGSGKTWRKMPKMKPADPMMSSALYTIYQHIMTHGNPYPKRRKP